MIEDSAETKDSKEPIVYFATVLLLMFVLPLCSIFAQVLIRANLDNWILLIGKWFVFWTVGIRLLLAGVRQVIRPGFTAERIFDIKGKEPLPIVQELGFANVAMGTLGTLSILNIHWIVPSALAGAIFYGCAGIKHITRRGKNRNEMIATISDMIAAVVLVFYLVFSQT
jgi:hypothetical protein